jgi:hypothetical protein
MYHLIIKISYKKKKRAEQVSLLSDSNGLRQDMNMMAYLFYLSYFDHQTGPKCIPREAQDRK